MANRYWVGGTASWDGTAGSKWALTSGGAGGQAVPTSADDVFFDAASGVVTVSISSGSVAKSINCTGFTGTLSYTGNVTVSGSITLVSAMTFNGNGLLTTFNATGTLTTAGKTFTGITVNTAGITLTLGDALICGQITLLQGTFTTNNFNVTATAMSSSGSSVRTINLGSSTVTLSAGTAVNFSTNTNLTFNAGTSTIICNATLLQIDGGAGTTPISGVTFYNVSFTNTSATSFSIGGTNTFNNLTVTGPASANCALLNIQARQIINGTLSTTGTAGNRRVWIRSGTYGIAQTLTINSAPSLTDADFRDIYVIGTAAPISGTRIGNRGGCSGITFDVAKTVYWNKVAGGNWFDNAWAATSGGAAADSNFPLAQDTAIIQNTGLNTSASIATPSSGEVLAVCTLDASARTLAMTLTTQVSTYHGDFKLGSGVTLVGSSTSTFSGRNTQTITSAGKTFSGGITIDSFGGTVQLADALNIGSNNLTVTHGTFNTQGYAVTAGSLSSTNSNVRAITLGASTLTLNGSVAVDFSTNTNLTFNAGTSTITSSATSASSVFGGPNTGVGLTFYDVTFSSTSANTKQIYSSNVFNNLTVTAPASAGLMNLTFTTNNTINGTLTCAGATAVRRVFLRSDTLGTTRTLTVNSLSATDCDFRDITIAGAAAGSSPTRAGDCGGNTGITFPGAKTVYWNLAGTQNWSATGWCPSSGGTPDINQFPLAQDTAVFDNAGSVTGTITIEASWNIGTFNASARTSAMTLTSSTNAPSVYGNWLFGTGVTLSSTTGTITFSGRGTSTITSNGVTFGTPITVNSVTGTLQLADALTINSSRTLTLTSGTFDAVTYNVTVGNFLTNSAAPQVLKMGLGSWTLTASGLTPWNMSSSGLTFYKGTANIFMPITNQFSGGGLSYNKLTLTGSAASSTSFITGNNQFTEFASTVTIAHTISLGSTTQTLGAWTVTGTAGNVVTVSGTATITIAGARVSGVDYLALGTTTISATSPGEFYAGANSTGGTNAILTAAPAAVTRYWRGGSGTWDATTTTNWSATSGGLGGASVPTSADAVVFDTMSNATAYTVTCTATQLRCASFTMAGPATGNVTWAGTAPLAVHGNFSLSATGITRSYTGNITLSGSATGRTLTTNGQTLDSTMTINGVGCGWSLGSALNDASRIITINNGSFDLANYNLTCNVISSDVTHSRTINFGSSTLTIGGILFGTSENSRANLTFPANTAQINFNSTAFTGNNQTFYNVNSTLTSANTVTFEGINTFNNLTITNIASTGLKFVNFANNQTVNGTLTLSAGTNATMRTSMRSDTIGTTRTLTCAAFSGTDADFRDITIAGAAAPVSGTRLGDCKGNSGITFGAGVNKYWNLAGGGNWSDTAWALSSGGAVNANNFPLAQDTALFESTGLNSGATVIINAAWNIGTVDMSARTSNTMTWSQSSNPAIYGNWITGTGVTYGGVATATFAGRTTQTFTSAGRTITFRITINTPGGSFALQDAFVSNNATNAIDLISGTFNLNGYSALFSGVASVFYTNNRTVAFGSGSTWTIAGSGTSWSALATGLTITGTGTISLTSASAKTFAGGDISYSGVTLNQGGAGALTITGNNTFKDITNTYKTTGATNITLGTTTQTVSQFTAAGEAGRVLTIQGTSASSPGTLVLTGATKPNVDYLTITGVRAYSLTDTWYAGTNSTNNGSLGWLFTAGSVLSVILEAGSGADSVSATLTLSLAIAESASGVESIISGFAFDSSVAEAASGIDSQSNIGTFTLTVLEAASGLEELFPSGSFSISVSEAASGIDSISSIGDILLSIAESASGADSIDGGIAVSLSILEAASGVDVVLPSGTFGIVVSESASGSDLVLSIATVNNTVSESASGLDDQNANITFTLSVSEIASGLDSLVPTAFITTIINEAAAALEALGVGGTFNIAVTEAAAGQDQASNIGTFNIVITEASTGNAVLTARLLWEPIDDSQTPNWTTITNTQNPNWVPITTQ
jgi:hypothetical protein